MPGRSRDIKVICALFVSHPIHCVAWIEDNDQTKTIATENQLKYGVSTYFSPISLNKVFQKYQQSPPHVAPNNEKAKHISTKQIVCICR